MDKKVCYLNGRSVANRSMHIFFKSMRIFLPLADGKYRMPARFRLFLKRVTTITDFMNGLVFMLKCIEGRTTAATSS